MTTQTERNLEYFAWGYVILVLLGLIIFQIVKIVLLTQEKDQCQSSESQACKVFTCPYDTSDVNPCGNTPFTTTDGVTFYCQSDPTTPVTL